MDEFFRDYFFSVAGEYLKAEEPRKSEILDEVREKLGITNDSQLFDAFMLCLVKERLQRLELEERIRPRGKKNARKTH